MDPVSFLASLPSSLRQQVLADMDDSTVAVLPPDLAAEAQALRRELEERHRRLMQERLFAQAAGAGSLSAILRHQVLGVVWEEEGWPFEHSPQWHSVDVGVQPSQRTQLKLQSECSKITRATPTGS